MYKQLIFIVLVFFIIFNIYKYNKEHFSNTYQDTELRTKLSHFGTNLDEKKPLLTLYYDRREPNCKYFYDYFSTHYGGLKKDEDHNLRFQSSFDSIYSGKSQPWNQLKAIYSDDRDLENKFIKPDFLRIEEIEVEDGHLYDFNKKPAYLISEKTDLLSGKKIGTVEYDGEKPKEYKQYLKPKDFLKRIPFVTLSFFKHKDKKDIEEILESLNKGIKEGDPQKTYDDLEHFQKYEYYVIEYNGIYSPNNRQVKATLDNIIKFINDTYEEYLECPDEARHNARIGEGLDEFTRHTFDDKNKCSVCSEYFT